MSRLITSQRAWLTPNWVREDLSRKAQALPSLDLRFADNKSLADATTGANLVTFTRASSGTYVGSNGVLQTATTNLLLRSEEFDNASWTKAGLLAFGSGSTANAITAPNGSTAADLLTEDTSTGRHRAYQTVSDTVNANAYTLSVYVKAKERTRFYVGIVDSPSFSRQGNAIFNLSNGTVVSASAGLNGATGGVASIQDVGNGWYRCSYALVLGGTNTAIFCDLNIVSAGSTISYTGDGTSGIYLWGAQLEKSSTVGEYIPTTSTINSAPRFDHNPTTGESLGLLVEEQRTNWIRNNTMVGAVAGTPGTLPTNWVIGGAGIGTLTQQVVGVGTIGSLSYVDVRYSGTTSTTNFRINFEPNTQVVAASGQNWTASVYTAVMAGSTSNITSVQLGITERSNTGTFLDESASVVNTASSIARTAQSRTFNQATTAYCNSFVAFNFSSGVTIDITVRIGLPQLEQGAFATSVIPTTTATATRNADVASITGTNFSSWYNSSASTLYSEAQSASGSAYTGYVYTLGADFNNSITHYRQSDFQPVARIRNAGVDEYGATGNGAIWTGTSVNKFALAISPTSGRQASNGSLNSSGDDSSISAPSASSMTLGALVGTPFLLNGTIRRLCYWPARLPNSTLQTLTQ